MQRCAKSRRIVRSAIRNALTVGVTRTGWGLWRLGSTDGCESGEAQQSGQCDRCFEGQAGGVDDLKAEARLRHENVGGS